MPEYVTGDEAKKLAEVLEPMDSRRDFKKTLEGLTLWSVAPTWAVFPLKATPEETLKSNIMSAAGRLGLTVEVYRMPEGGPLLYVRKVKEAAQ